MEGQKKEPGTEMELKEAARMINEEIMKLIKESRGAYSAVKETITRIHWHMVMHPDRLQPKIPNFDYQKWEKEYLEIIKKIRARRANMRKNLAELDIDMVDFLDKVNEKYGPEYLEIIKNIRARQANMRKNLNELDIDMVDFLDKVNEKYGPEYIPEEDI